MIHVIIIFANKNDWGLLMNTRKFFYIISIALGCFLFTLGSFFMFYINSSNSSGKNGVPGIFDGLVTGKKPMNFLLLVGDNTGNTDSMMVVNYNPKNNKLSLLTIPRDTRVKLKNNTLPKINAAYGAGGRKHEGAAYAAQVVSDLTGININYYVHINLEAIKKITDMLGGVYFDVPTDMKYSDPSQGLYIDLKKGYQHLDGDKVEQLLRFRKPSGKYTSELKQYYDGSDIKRTEMQIKFLKEFMKQKLTIQYLPRYNSVINYAFSNMITNMKLNDALNLAQGVINISPDTLTSFRLGGEDKSLSSGWFYIYNETIVNIETKEALAAEDVIKEYFASEKGIASPVPDSNVKEPSKSTTSKPTTTKKPSTSTKNPSNSQSDSKGEGTDKP